MKIIEYISYLTIPFMILAVLAFAIKEKKETYLTFLQGAREGMNVILKIFPTMLGILVAINLFQVTGTMEIMLKLFSPVIQLLKIPAELLPIGIMRSISGGASMGLLTNLLTQYGPDSEMRKMASTILGSSETTLYVIAMYTSTIGVKNHRGILKIALFCDFVAFCASVWIWKLYL